MAHAVETIKPHVWNSDEAYRSGKGGYRIGVELSGNPFTPGPLADAWAQGHKDAAAADPFSRRKADHFAEERHERSDKRKFGRPDRGGVDVARPFTKSFPKGNARGGGRGRFINRNTPR